MYISIINAYLLTLEAKIFENPKLYSNVEEPNHLFLAGSQNPCYENAFGCSDLCHVKENGQAHCTCSDDKHVKLPDGKTCVSKDARCSKTDFVCHDKQKCIPKSALCDNVTNCLDGSDEFPTVCSKFIYIFLCKGFSK